MGKIDACQSTTGKPKPLSQQNLVRQSFCTISIAS